MNENTHILIVEDEKQIARFLQMELEHEGYICSIEYNGAAALDRIGQEHFDLILLDPPYAAGLLEPVIAHIARFDILSPHGIIIAEHPADKALPALEPPYRLHRTYRYGKIGLTVYRRSGNQDSEESAP